MEAGLRDRPRVCSSAPVRPAFTRRAVLGLGTASVAASLLPGCRRRRTLTVYNWGDYLARSVVERFEKQHGVRVVQDFFASEDQMEAKLRARARFDLVVPIGYVLSVLQRDGLLAPLDPLPTGVEHLDPQFAPWTARASRGGGVYGVPYLWGTTGIGYDSERVDPPTSWNALFDDRYAGHISVIDSKGDVLDQGLLAAGLGINSVDKGRIAAEVWPRLRAQKKILRAYDTDPARALISGETWIAQIDSGDLIRAARTKPSLRYVIPKEGAALWVDYLAIPAAAANPGRARALVEFLLQPENAAENADALGFATPNRTALDRGLVRSATNPAIYPPEDVRATLQRSENWDGSVGEQADEIWLDLRAR